MLKFTTSLVAAGFMAIASANAGVMTNLLSENFDDEATTFGTQLNFTNFSDFVVSTGSVDLIAPGNPYGISCVSGGCIDLDGSTRGSTPASVIVSSAIMSFTAGQTYTLSFDYSGNQRGGAADSFEVTIGNLFSQTFTNIGPDNPFSNFTVSFLVVSDTMASLSFSELGRADNIGVILDNISLSTDMSAVPLPAALPLFGGAMVAGAALRRRRKHVA